MSPFGHGYNANSCDARNTAGTSISRRPFEESYLNGYGDLRKTSGFILTFIPMIDTLKQFQVLSRSLS